ncbi:MAG: dockerin type I repeat-containing protein [Oscillospiraceae bacterium]|nr:dockerin type I repeat-containing protein [Oscillospiraceae bacterium]
MKVKQMLAKVLVLALCLGLLPTMALPAAAEAEDSGTVYKISLSTKGISKAAYTVTAGDTTYKLHNDVDDEFESAYKVGNDTGAISDLTNYAIEVGPYAVETSVNFIMVLDGGYKDPVVAVAQGTGELVENSVKTVDGTLTFTATFTATNKPMEVSVTAKAKEKFDLTVEGGAGSGQYAYGDTVTVEATTPEGKHFKEWVATGIELPNNTVGSLTFEMPNNAVTLTAIFEDDIVTPGDDTNSTYHVRIDVSLVDGADEVEFGDVFKTLTYQVTQDTEATAIDAFGTIEFDAKNAEEQALTIVFETQEGYIVKVNRDELSSPYTVHPTKVDGEDNQYTLSVTITAEEATVEDEGREYTVENKLPATGVTVLIGTEPLAGDEVNLKAGSVITVNSNSPVVVAVSKNGGAYSPVPGTPSEDGKSCTFTIEGVEESDEDLKIGFILRGDVNGDGDVTLLDAVEIQKFKLNATTIEGIFSLAADMNKDGDIVLLDAVEIQKVKLNTATIMW